MGRVEKKHNRPHKTRHLDRRTASYRRPVLLTWAKLPRVGFSPWARGSDGPRNGHLRRPGCSETPRTLGRRSYEAGGGAAPGISPPPPPTPSPRAGATEGGWDRGCHPACFRQECGSEEGGEREGKKKIKIFTSWGQNNNKITGMFAKEGAGLGKVLGGGEKVSVSSAPKCLGWWSAPGKDGKHQKGGSKLIYGSNIGVRGCWEGMEGHESKHLQQNHDCTLFFSSRNTRELSKRWSLRWRTPALTLTGSKKLRHRVVKGTWVSDGQTPWFQHLGNDPKRDPSGTLTSSVWGW